MGNSLDDNDGLGEYRIAHLVSVPYQGIPLENIDFARHLRSDKALNKKIYKLPNGRPQKAEYYDGLELVAEIEFYFETDANNLLTRRQEHLYYYRQDDTRSAMILIKDKIFDLSDLQDGEAVMTERVLARTSIVSSMKAFLGGVLQLALGQTLAEVVVTIQPFWDEFEQNRNDFIELGSQDWLNAMIALDLGTTPHTYLAIPVAPGVTVRDYMVSRLSY